jgi:hypothetical protein
MCTSSSLICRVHPRVSHSQAFLKKYISFYDGHSHILLKVLSYREKLFSDINYEQQKN